LLDDTVDFAQALGWETQGHDLADAHPHIPGDNLNVFRREFLVKLLPLQLVLIS
jgi:hypothetical protein